MARVVLALVTALGLQGAIATLSLPALLKAVEAAVRHLVLPEVRRALTQEMVVVMAAQAQIVVPTVVAVVAVLVVMLVMVVQVVLGIAVDVAAQVVLVHLAQVAALVVAVVAGFQPHLLVMVAALVAVVSVYLVKAPTALAEAAV